MKSKQGRVIRRVLTLIKPYRAHFFLLLFFALLTVSATLYTPILIGDGVDCIVGAGNVDYNALAAIIGRFLIVIAAASVSQWCMNLVTNHITYHVVKNIRIAAFDHMEELPLSYIDAHSTGDAISRITTDVEQFSDGLLMGFTQLFTGVLTILGTLGFMLALQPGVTLVVVLITPVSFFVAAFIARRTYTLFRRTSEIRSELTQTVEEKIGNLHVVKAFSREETEQEIFEDINERLRETSVRAIFFSAAVNPSTRFVNGLVYTGVCIVGALLAIGGGISVGGLASFLNYANQYTKPFNEISGVVTELQNAIACAGRIFDFLDAKPIEPDQPDATVLKETRGRIECSHVDFSYDPKTPFITDMNICAKSGQRIALVGPTGCGKTTLVNLLMRFYETDGGRILVDGQDTRTLTRNSLRAGFGMVLQDTWLKNASIADNIAYGKPDATPAEIEAAARMAHAHSFISRMPEKYDTIITEDGGNISQGQKQLLCIARVFLMRPPMLILDEATSSIDTRTEILVQEAFERLMEGRTSFVVAHRLSTIQGADRILVMRDGHIVESGTHEVLLAQGGFYAKLYNSQFAVPAS